MGKGEALAEATIDRQLRVQEETRKKQPEMRHMTMISPGGIVGAVLFREVGK